jgi:sugar/nucleoside kinase (ribokinase family)
VLCCIGDLVEDIVVWLSSDIATGTDTTASIRRRRGGSAANVAARAASTGIDVRFIGRVGSDAIGTALIDELRAGGVDPRVQQVGRTGTIVVLVDASGERSMLPDRAAATELDTIGAHDIAGVDWLHVPAYSLDTEPLASATRLAIQQVRLSGGLLSIDASSVAVIQDMGADVFSEMINELGPDIVLCNTDEAAALRVVETKGLRGVGVTVVKSGRRPAVAYSRGALVASVPAISLEHVRDTTGAGDAFAAGFIAARMESDDIAPAIIRGHELAAQVLAEHSS